MAAVTHDQPQMEDRMSIKRYIITRIPTLAPPMNPAPNPFTALTRLNRQQWLFFSVAFIGWSWDAFDFFTSHGSQDLYPTILEDQFKFSANAVTVTQVVANVGAVIGGTLCGWASQIFGRRLSIIIVCIVGGALLYPYTFVTNDTVIAVAFFEQFMVQGAWGIMPAHLMELSPGPIRTFVVGTAYQLGNLASSASSTIESTIGERFPLPPLADGTKRYNYGKVTCIFLGCVFAAIILVTLVGPEHLGRNFDDEYDAGIDIVVAVHGGLDRVEDESDPEKAMASRKEKST